MSPIDKLLERLPGAKKGTDNWSARCPAHDDRHASLSIGEGDDGKALVKCHAGCSVEAIMRALGLAVRDLMPERNGTTASHNGKPRATPRTFATAEEAAEHLEKRHGRSSATWEYHDLDGNLVGLVLRWDLGDGKKDFRPVSRRGDGWVIGAMPTPRTLYNLPEVARANLVIVTEGEKAADAARSLGFTATTSAGGSQAAEATDWQPLAGKEVWVLPDNDAPGRKYAHVVVAELAKRNPATQIRVVELPELPEHGDLVDWIEAHGDAAEPAGMREEIEALARAVEPEPDDNTADDSDRYHPFPVDVLPEPIRGFVTAAARAILCDASYLALPLLVSIAAAIGNTRRLQLKRGWSAPAILWGVIVGESGTAKTPAFKLVMRPIRERQQMALEKYAEEMTRFELEHAVWEKEYTAWKKSKNAEEEPPKEPRPPVADRFIVSDTTVEALAPILLENPRGLLLACDELAGWFGSFDRYAGKGKAKADSAHWMSMFNAESLIVDRKTGIPRTIFVPRASVCVVGGIQPGILRRSLGDEHRESGMAARPLLAFPPRRKKKWTEADIDPQLETGLVQLFDRLFELQPTVNDLGQLRPVDVKLTPDAKDSWVKFYDAHAQEQVDLTGDLSAAWSKLEEYAARLALVIHFVRWAAKDPTLINDDFVDEQSMSAGIRLTEWFKHEARRIYVMLDEPEALRNERKLLEWIERKGGSVTVREVQQGCRWLKEPGAAEAALEDLVKAGRGKWNPTPTTTKGGRPSRVFELSTASTSTEP